MTNPEFANLTWALILLGFAVMGLTIVIFYLAERKPKKRSQKK